MTPHPLADRIARLKDAEREIRAFVMEYARHLSWCAYKRHDSRDCVCDCGFEARTLALDATLKDLEALAQGVPPSPVPEWTLTEYGPAGKAVIVLTAEQAATVKSVLSGFHSSPEIKCQQDIIDRFVWSAERMNAEQICSALEKALPGYIAELRRAKPSGVPPASAYERYECPNCGKRFYVELPD